MYRVLTTFQTARTDVRYCMGRSAGSPSLRTGLRPTKLRIVASSGEGLSDEAAKLLAETDKLMQKLGGTSTPGLPATSFTSDAVLLQCDDNGCTIVPVSNEQEIYRGPTGSVLASADSDDDAPIDFDMMEGQGWKLGYDRAVEDPDAYSAVIGGDSWMATLTRAEYNDFVKSLLNLQRSIATLELCGEWTERGGEATMDVSTEQVWLQGRAPGKTLSALQEMWNEGGPCPGAAFSVRFIFTGAKGGREVGGTWSATAVLEVLKRLGAEQKALNGTPELETADVVSA